MFALAGAGLPSVLLVAAFFGFVHLVRRSAPANAQVLFNLALACAYVMELVFFLSGIDQLLSPLVLLAITAVLPPRLGRAIVARHPSYRRPLIHCAAALGLALIILGLFVVFSRFNFSLFMLISPLGIALYWMADRLHEEGR